MPTKPRTGRNYGLTALFALVTLVAIGIRLGQWFDAKANPVSDFHGTIVFTSDGVSRPAGNIKVWIRETAGDLTEEDMLDLGLVEKEFEILEEPPEPDETEEEETEEEVYELPQTPEDIQPGAGADFGTKSDAAGNFTFRNLKRGHHYTIWTEEEDWVVPALEVSAKERQQTLPNMQLTKGGIVKIKIWSLQLDRSFKLPTVFRSRGAASPDYEWPKNVGVGDDGIVELRLAPGLNQVWSTTAIQQLVSIGSTHTLATHVDAGQVCNYDFGYDASSGLLIPIIQNRSNGHFYLAFEFGGNWQEAKKKAASLHFKSMQGHLVTITNEQEDLFLRTSFREMDSWTAGVQLQEDLHWQWATGPEKELDFPGPTTFRNLSNKRMMVRYDQYMLWSRGKRHCVKLEHTPEHLIVEFSPAE